MSAQLDLFITELRKMSPTERVFFWTGWDKDPYSDEQFRQYLMPSKELLAILTNQPIPAPATIRVKVNASPSLRVRSKTVDGDVIGQLANKLQVEVFEAQEVTGWYKLVNTAYAGNYISAQYVEKVI